VQLSIVDAAWQSVLYGSAAPRVRVCICQMAQDCHLYVIVLYIY